MAAPESQSLIGTGREEKATPWPKIFGGAGLATTGLVLGAGMMYLVQTQISTTTWMPMPEDANAFSEDRICGTSGSFSWERVSSVDGGARKAIKKMMRLLNLERQYCEVGKMPALPFELDAFENGDKSDGTYIHVNHKFTPTCEEETYKLHAFVPGPEGGKSAASFSVHLFHTIKDDRWELLKSTPDPCYIEAGLPAAPDIRSPDDQDVQQYAIFAVASLEQQQKQQGCLVESGKLWLEDVRNAVSRLGSGLMMDMLLTVKADPPVEEIAQATIKVRVLEECDLTKTGVCVKQLVLTDPKEDVCSIMASHQASERRRLESIRGGWIPRDPTDEKLVQKKYFKQLLNPRQLRSGKKDRPPIRLRFIKTGDVPAEWDPREEECHKHIPVYDQGACGSCYAMAAAGAMGLRKCNHDKGLNGKPHEKRRLQQAVQAVNMTSGRPLLRELNGQEDDPEWHYPGEEYDCKWFEKNDPGCTELLDEGQHEHCKSACDTRRGSRGQDPWKDLAWYKYMPDPAQLAQCSGRGCRGGGFLPIWEDHLMGWDQDTIPVMGEKCQPYNLKCWGCFATVSDEHARESDQCGGFVHWEPWHKPCQCIPSSLRPTEYQCTKTKVSAKCGFPVPVTLHSVVTYGLKPENRVLNIQRHIYESGPVFICHGVSEEFSNWDWAKNPIYTGGEKEGDSGHSVVAVGWGTQDNVDFWILRNSWGPDWGENGYYKFKRGINLDWIESGEITAPYFYDKDAIPVCYWDEAQRWWDREGSEINQYEYYINMLCYLDGGGNLTISVSPFGKSDELVDTKETVRVGQSTKPQIVVKLHCYGYGLEEDDMNIVITMTDSKGNTGEQKHDVTIPAIPGKTTIGWNPFCPNAGPMPPPSLPPGVPPGAIITWHTN